MSALVASDRQVPALLDRPLAQPALAHDGTDGAGRKQGAQDPQQVRAGRQLGAGGEVEQGPLHRARLQAQPQRTEPVVDVAGQRGEGVVADLADPVATQEQLAQAAHVAAAGHHVLLDAGYVG
jgi:hypothetical protein